ncbi:hypothetical protein Daus18300_011385 [Diaporthe australafricana]|uniref:ABM domain-containing protein n=1 Tax=Diaporthe australafricana TaxID=127596 RepID=A0ABR3W6I1_9PEZI
MSGAVVELVVLALKEGVDLTEDGLYKDAMGLCMSETNRRPGCHAIYRGTSEEQPGYMYLIAEWGSLQAHKDWQSHPDYGNFMTRTFSSAQPDSLQVTHFYLIPHEPITAHNSPFNAPITAISSMYYPASVDVEAYRAQYETYRTEVAKVAPVQGMQGGWVLEETKLPGAREGKAKLFMQYTGWARANVNASQDLMKEGGVASDLLKDSKSRSTVHVAFHRTSSSQWQVGQLS